MQRTTLASRLMFAALVCVGCLMWADSASAQDNTVQGQNGATASAAISAPASSTNALQFNAGPSANGVGAPAQASQQGDNVASERQRSEARSGDASAGSQVHGVVGGGHTVQNQNSSVGAVAVSAPAVSVNVTAANVGPQANGLGAPASASQIGGNRYDGTHLAIAESGDAVAGSQVTGIVGIGAHTVQNQNNALNPVALSGVAVSVNFGTNSVGPNALGLGAPASASQIGSNDAVFVQSNEAKSGDAVAGGQVTGIVGVGSATVQNQSSAAAPIAVSGPVLSVNATLLTNVGPTAVGGAAPAQASQLGNNSAEVAQVVDAASGDAVAGGQVTGVVGDQAGAIRVQNQQTSAGDIAISGAVLGIGNFAGVFGVGPTAVGLLAPAQSSQAGNNTVSFIQDATLQSGDALAGAQVTGVVSQGGDTTVQNQNTSLLGIAVSGPVVTLAANAAVAGGVGPLALGIAAPASAQQLGDNNVAAAQTANLESGDAIAGSQVTGAINDPASITVQNQNTSFAAFALTGGVTTLVGNAHVGSFAGPVAIALAAPASASQFGSNAVVANQEADVASGDAVAGSQVTGVVATGGTVKVQNQNTSILAIGLSGGVVNGVVNLSAGSLAGPAALAIAAPAQSNQIGGNSVGFDQTADVSSGDAVSGGQVTGVVTHGGDVTVQNSDTSLATFAVSGGVTNGIANLTAGALGGPGAVAFAAPAQASQFGSNAVFFSQDVVVASGDAIAGGQVTGIVTGTGDVTVQNQNTSILAFAISGAAGGPVSNVALGVGAGPIAVALAAPASATQLGSNDVAIAQGLVAESGDAVAGSQVTGIVNGSGDVTVQAQNTSFFAFSVTGSASAMNIALAARSGPLAVGVLAPAQASHIGGTTLDLSQRASATTGDAVGGSQVIGTAEDDSTIQLQNNPLLSLALTSPSTTTNFATGSVGASAIGLGATASAQHLGNSAAMADQVGEADSGDAISGGQVTGVAGFGSGSLSTGGALMPSTAPGTGFEISTSASS